jgi:hypothetical protein
MSKILNLDSLAAPKRTVTLNNQDYQVKDMTVQDFIEITKRAEELESKKAGFLENFEATIETVSAALPGCPKEVLRGLTIEQMGALTKFIRGEFDDKLKPEQEDSKN